MSNAPVACDSKRLQRLLENHLPEAEESLVTEHVAGCETCRTQLEGLAAHRGWSRKAARQLQSSEWKGDGTLSLQLGEVSSTDDLASDAWIQSLDFLEPSDNPTMLGRMGAYDILETIGSGGFGIVLKGFDRELNRYVAVKVLAPHLAHSAAARKRFAREAQAAAAIVHPHVVPIHAVQAAGPLPFLVMPFIAGESLQQRLDRTGPLELKEVLRIGMQTALGLAAAHAQGLVHRDIKPANILLEHAVDRVMLTDFGLARAMDDASLTRSTVIAGTPQYMSPEQARGEQIDSRTDLFSLGSVLYAMCAGYPPFRAETMLGVLRRVSEESPRSIREVNGDIPSWLAAVIERLLAKNAAQRFRSAADVAELLEKCLAHVQQPAVIGLPPELTHNSARSTVRILAIGAVVAVVVAVLSLSWSIVGPRVFGTASLNNAEQDGGQQQFLETDRRAIELRSPAEADPVPSSSPAPSTWHDTTDDDLRAIDFGIHQLEQAAGMKK